MVIAKNITGRIGIILISSLILLVLVFQPVAANGVPAPNLNVSGSVSYSAGGSAVVIAPGLTLTGPNIDNARVSITGNFESNDRLGIQGAGTATSGTASGIAWSYTTTTGIMNLQNTASADTYQSVLRQVTYYSASGTPSTAQRTVNFSVGSGLYCTDTGHYYEFKDSSLIWNDAKTAATGLNYYGLQGYLATVTSVPENNFIKSKLQGYGWMGASDATTESEWYWVTGPETGTYFFKQTSAHSVSPDLNTVYGGSTPGGGNAVSNRYNNWATNEPNDCSSSGEDYGHFFTTGLWNDYPGNITLGYVAEYGGMAGDPVLQLQGNATVSVSAIITPTTASVTAPANGAFYNGAPVPTSVTGTAADDATGSGLNANSTTFTIKRSTDNNYWNGSDWVASAFWLATTHSDTTSGTSVTWISNVTLPTWANATYTIQAKATNKSSGSFTGTGISFICDSTAPAITLTAVLQGSKRPAPVGADYKGYNVPLTVKAYLTSKTLDSSNILTESAQYISSTAAGQITITNVNTVTNTITFSVTGLPAGTYHIALHSTGCLINLINNVAVSGGTPLDMGILLAGNADDYVTPVTSNQTQVFGSDFNMVLNDYLQQAVGDKWNSGRCDFDRNGQVTSIDFSLLIDNYTQTSPKILN